MVPFLLLLLPGVCFFWFGFKFPFIDPWLLLQRASGCHLFCPDSSLCSAQLPPVPKPHLHTQEPTVCGGMAPLPQPSFQPGASLGPGQCAVPGDSAQRMCPALKGTVLLEVFDVAAVILFFRTLLDLPVKWNYTSLWTFTVRIALYNVYQTPIWEPGTEYMSVTGHLVVIISVSSWSAWFCLKSRSRLPLRSCRWGIVIQPSWPTWLIPSRWWEGPGDPCSLPSLCSNLGHGLFFL